MELSKEDLAAVVRDFHSLNDKLRKENGEDWYKKNRQYLREQFNAGQFVFGEPLLPSDVEPLP